LRLNDIEYFTNVITTGYSTAKWGKRFYQTLTVQESADKEQQVATAIQDRGKSEAGEGNRVKQKGQK